MYLYQQRCSDTILNPKPSPIFHSTHHYAFQNLSFHFPPICGDTYIVQYLYCDVCNTRPLPTPGLFPIFSFFHQKNTTSISCGVVVPSPANFIVITMDLARAVQFQLFLYKKIEYFLFEIFPAFIYKENINNYKNNKSDKSNKKRIAKRKLF